MKDREKEQIEELLLNYRKIKSNVRTKALEKISPNYLTAINYEESTPGEQENIYSKVEERALKRAEKDSDMFKLARARDIIKTSKDSLSIEKRRIITYLWFEGLSRNEVGRRVKGYSESTISNRKREILQELKEAGILKAWKYWEEVKSGSKV